MQTLWDQRVIPKSQLDSALAKSLDDATWRRVAIFWVNYPNNPTAAVAPLSFYEELSQLASRYGFLLATPVIFAAAAFMIVAPAHD